MPDGISRFFFAMPRKLRKLALPMLEPRSFWEKSMKIKITQNQLDRRQFLDIAKWGMLSASLMALGVRQGSAGFGKGGGGGGDGTPAHPFQVTLTVTEALVEMVDEVPIYHWVYELSETTRAAGPQFPGPVLQFTEGNVIDLTVHNTLDEPHSFTIPDVVDTGPIAPNQSIVVSFAAPSAGTYLYFDSLNAPVNRVLGLHGAFIVHPRTGNTPFSRPTPAVLRLFNDLGGEDFPGDPWRRERDLIWLFHTIDPVFNEIAHEGREIDADQFNLEFLPTYFTINGRSGFFSAHNPDTAPRGTIGQPALIRNLNAGMAVHSPHIHGNHVYLLSENGRPEEDVNLLDTWSLDPLDRRDLLLPFIIPPDIPKTAWPPKEERFPLAYPMHCHMELSQTANGGNYPQGLITHWEISGLHGQEEAPPHGRDTRHGN